MNSVQNASNLYNNQAPIIAGVAPAVSVEESLPPLRNYRIGDSVLQQVAKLMAYQHSNPPLKDESGLTFNNTALPLPRKRLRDSSFMATTPAMNSNRPLISVPTGKASCRYGAGCDFSFLGEDLSLEMRQQQLEVGRLISLHMEKVRREIEERRREQRSRIIQAIQAAMWREMRDKEEQIEKIAKQNWALEERVRSLYLESQIWRDLAQTNEATANALRSNLEQVLTQANNKNFRICSGAAVATDDAESCCGSSGRGCEEEGDEVDGGHVLKWKKVGAGGERKIANSAEEERRRMCRRCGARESSVLLLPCRHLCLCTACGSAVDNCPVCNSTNDATVHVNLS